MKSLIKATGIFLLIAVSGVLNAQDAHLSQYFNSPVFYNPANIGFGIDNIRIAGIYRSQWQSVSPYKTQSFAVDKIVKRVGFGAILTNNGAGDAGINRLSMLAGISYSLPLGDEGKNLITAGMQVGVLQKSFDPSKMTFDEQFSNDQGFNPNSPTGEVFANTKVTRPDMNFGIAWHYGTFSKDIKLKPFAGIAFYHINQPKESFIEDDNVNPIRTNIQAGVSYAVTDGFEIKPMALMMKQQDFQETNYGVISTFSLNKKNMMQLGAFMRSNDAIIAYAGYQMNKIFMGLSYDINNSRLSDNVQGANAFEISLIYTPQGKNKNNMLKKPVKKPKKLQPPVEDNQDETADVSNKIKLIPNPENNVQPIKPTDNLKQLSVDLKNSTIAYKDDGKKKKEMEVLAKAKTEIRPQGQPREKIIAQPEVIPQPEAVSQPELAMNTEPEPKGKVKKEPKPVVSKAVPSAEPVKQPVAETIHYDVFETVFFYQNKSAFNIDNRFDRIEAVVDFLYKYPDAKIVLYGHTDKKEENSNPALSNDRAVAVKNYIISKGINSERIDIKALRDAMPYNGKENITNPNSRVEISLANN